MSRLTGIDLWEKIRHAEHAAFSTDDLTIPLRQFLAAAAALVERQPDLNRQQRLVIDSQDPIEGLLLVTACWMAGVQPVLDSRPRQRSHATDPIWSWGDFCHIALADWLRHTAPADFPTEPPGLFAASGLTLAFRTSGSTGDGTLVEKNWTSLLTEAYALQALLNIRTGDEVVALVPPVHIYGFLYAVLLPWISDARTQFVGLSRGLLPDLASSRHSLLVMTPSSWPVICQAGWHQRFTNMVTSGAPFGAAREAEYKASMRDEAGTGQMFEVLGSTETGGIGWRSLARPFALAGVDPELAGRAIFRRFDGVEIEDQDQAAILRSPFTVPANVPMPLSDRIGMIDEQHFVHLGRSDRVVKIGSQRLSLAEIEANLTEICRFPVRCIFRDDPRHAKGGELSAFIMGEYHGSLAILRRDYLQRFQTPFPERIFLTGSVQADAMGKIPISQLIELSREIRH
jgi:acyl-CoA synthetase (AMP-forming)/AMP-acid ligase II